MTSTDAAHPGAGQRQTAGHVEAFGGEGRWHAEVDDGQVGIGCGDGALDRRCAAHVGDDVVAGGLEEAGDPRPHQEVVISHDYPHGRRADRGAASTSSSRSNCTTPEGMSGTTTRCGAPSSSTTDPDSTKSRKILLGGAAGGPTTGRRGAAVGLVAVPA